MQITGSFTRKGLQLAGYFLTGLIVVDAILFFVIKTEVNQQKENVEKITLYHTWTEALTGSVAAVDRFSGSAVATRDQEIITEYGEAIGAVAQNMDSIRYHFQRYDVGQLMIEPMNQELGEAIGKHESLLESLQAGDSTGIVTQFGELPSVFDVASSLIDQYNVEKELSANVVLTASPGWSAAITVIQIILLAGAPVLVLIVITLRSYRHKFVSFNREIDESNRKYVFDSLEPVDYENEEEIKSRLLSNLKKASDFIQKVAEGDYSVRWEGMNDQNRDVNRENIAGELIRMREQMKQVKAEDEARIWATEGLSTFGEIIRKHQDNFDLLADSLISNLVKYLKAKVGGLFIVEEREDTSKFLQLRACYAYDRKKFLDKQIDLGEGLVGQTYLEGRSIYLKEVPDEYMQITSGLGDTTPRCLLVVPLKANEKIEGVLELASLNEFKPHEIEFLEKLAETLASSIVSVKTAEKTKDLLLISQEQAEQMRAQEEEMRQNMEELEATQEQMNRQMNELNVLKESLEKEKNLFGALMDNIPDAIYFKDKESKFIRVSKYLADHFNAAVDALIGKSDFDFQDEVHAREAFEDEKNIMLTRKPKIDFVEKETLADGSEHWVSTTKMPLVNAKGEVIGTFGISRDVSKLKLLERDVLNRDKKLREEEEQFMRRIKQLEDEIEAKEAEISKLKKK